MKHAIIIIDDHALLQQTWMCLINTHSDFEVIGTFGSAEAAIDQARKIKPVIALVDINLSGMNGIEATLRLRKYFPGIKIIGVSMHHQPALVMKMMRNGAMGYVTKCSRAAELFRALEEVVQGKKYICKEVKDMLAENKLRPDDSNITILSGREIEIIKLLKEGKSSREIAHELFLSIRTIEVHRYNILRKLGIRNTAALVQYVHANPLFE